jgi:formate hydrogenlyase transcriptional activator
MIEPELVGLLMRLADPQTRREGARALAEYFGADDLVCFVRDAETGVPLPVQGFSQTLPREWRVFLKLAHEQRVHEGALPVPGGSDTTRAVGFEIGDGGALVLLGGTPHPDRVAGARALLPLLAPTFASEMTLKSAAAQVDIERQAAQDAGVLTGALSAAQRNLERLAGREAALRREAQDVMRHIFEGTAANTGERFFASLVHHLASAGRVRYAFVTECRDQRRRARMLAFWKGDAAADPVEYDVAGTPCETVFEGRVAHYERGVQERFPADRDLVELGVESYLGLPMFDGSGQVIGHLVALDDKPMAEDRQRLEVLKIFAARAAAELERFQGEQRLRAALAEIEALKRQLQDENRYLREEIQGRHDFDEISGGSRAMQDVLDHIDRVAPLDATVLIMGETGTGKELVARAVHARSRRRERPLVKVNCGAIPAGLIESELFGHVKGAFTGAVDKRTGRFELANGGTIFLDEVGELPLDMQVKLLRVLQEMEFEPVGSSRTVHVNVRVIAATNRDLAAEVEHGRFRADLYYRLNVFPILLPPLRQRREDVSDLVQVFVQRHSGRLGRRPPAVTPDTMARLADYGWPGNVRELENVIERALVLSRGPVLEIDASLGQTIPVHAAHSLAGTPSPPAPPRPADAAAPPSPPARQGTLEEVERQHVLDVLALTGGVIEGPKGAAQILAMHPNTLRSRMKRLGISATPSRNAET